MPGISADARVATFVSKPAFRVFLFAFLIRLILVLLVPDLIPEPMDKLERYDPIALSLVEGKGFSLGNKPTAVAAAWDVRSDEKRLVAYVVPARQPRPAAGELRGVLLKKLPEYMVPSNFVFLDALPLTPNGKVDRRALPEPGKARPDLDTEYVAPRTPIEVELTKIWAEVLYLNRVGVHDNFIDLGGHSLAATRVVSQVIKTFQVEIPLRSFFEAPTVAEMAAVIEAHQGKKLGEADLECMLAELESLSEDEARRPIAEESEKLSHGERRD